MEIVLVRDHQSPPKVLCDVRKSDNRDENILFATDEVQRCFIAIAKQSAYKEWPPQPRLLYAIRLLVEAQEGRRDEEMERDVFGHFVSHHGLDTLTQMMSA